MSLYEGISCIIWQHLLILTQTPERLRTPGLFSSTRIALLLTGLWPSVMRSQMTAKGSLFPVPTSLQHEQTLTKTRWWLYSHFTHGHFYWRLTSLKSKDSCHPFIFIKMIAIWSPCFDHEEITRRLLKLHFRHCLKESYLDCVSTYLGVTR